MSQPKLEYITLAVAKKTGDEILSMTPSSDGNLFTSEQRINAINGARQNIYDSYYGSLGPEKFGELFTEFIKESSIDGDLAITNNLGPVPEDNKYIYAAKIRLSNTGDETTNPSKEAKFVPKEASYEAQYDTFSPYYADSSNYKLINQGTKVKVLGATIANGLIDYIYLADITPVVLGDDVDIPDPYSWRQRIIDEATRILLTDQQIA